jgi:hypothetical protein
MADADNGQNDIDADAGKPNDSLLGGDNKSGDAGANADADAGSKKGAEEASASSVPETYEFKMPDGITLDKGLADKASVVFKDLKLSQDQANSLVGIFAEQRKAEADAGLKAFRQQLDSWVEDIKADKDLGGEHFDKNAGIAASAIEKLGTPALKEMLNATGVGNNPELFRFCLKVGRLLAEDQPGSGTPAGGSEKVEDRLYAATTPQKG